MTERTRPTQADVARAAGVSQATVSMALNDGPEARGRLTEETRLRILAAVEETGYWGNLAAKHLAGGRTSVFGVFTYEPVFPHDSSDFYYPFLRGIEAEALQQDVDLLLFTSSHGGDPARGREGLRDWARRGRLHLADGCLLFGRHSHRRDLSELLAHDYPFVFIGRREADGAEVPYVGADYGTATEQVVEHLAALGHRRIALALEFPEHESGIDRRQGFDRAVQRLDVSALRLDGEASEVAPLLEDVLGTGTTAIAATPDLAAKLRMLALSRGLELPADLSIARLGDPEHLYPSTVEWSGFTIPRHEMGAGSVQMLLRLLQNPSRPGETQILLPCTVTAGSTTGPAPSPTQETHR
ncbi:LacI family DNA-binding transcriptional regulator [Brachybacterium paraconglomeratum]|uniref:LacI family DNA-binding transcriptional regulator n=1 Tax=Brachybacterium paraconglomeratum TaxID=173362 RepID=UPI0031E6DD9E